MRFDLLPFCPLTSGLSQFRSFHSSTLFAFFSLSLLHSRLFFGLCRLPFSSELFTLIHFVSRPNNCQVKSNTQHLSTRKHLNLLFSFTLSRLALLASPNQTVSKSKRRNYLHNFRLSLAQSLNLHFMPLSLSLSLSLSSSRLQTALFSHFRFFAAFFLFYNLLFCLSTQLLFVPFHLSLSLSAFTCLARPNACVHS
jgi:hypothetical protein